MPRPIIWPRRWIVPAVPFGAPCGSITGVSAQEQSLLTLAGDLSFPFREKGNQRLRLSTFFRQAPPGERTRLGRKSQCQGRIAGSQWDMFQRLFERSADAIFLFDPAREVFVDCNQAAV